ncbi:MAG: glycosyltransferase [Rikenellaceae bacterium]
MVYLRYLTFKTFIELNPDWTVVFWYPKKPFAGRSWGVEKGDQYINPKLCKDYLPEVLKLDITHMPIDFDSLGIHQNMAEVHKNDYIRIHSLALYGGVWSDTDIIYFKPMTDICINTEENKSKETYVCIGDYGHSTGLNMATEGSQFFEYLSGLLKREYNPKNYQCWGPDMFNKYYRKFENIPNAVNIPMDVIYAHNCHNVAELLENSQPRFTENSIGCHWYGGNSIWGKFMNETNGGSEKLQNNLICQLIRNAQ